MITPWLVAAALDSFMTRSVGRGPADEPGDGGPLALGVAGHVPRVLVDHLSNHSPAEMAMGRLAKVVASEVKQ